MLQQITMRHRHQQIMLFVNMMDPLGLLQQQLQLQQLLQLQQMVLLILVILQWELLQDPLQFLFNHLQVLFVVVLILRLLHQQQQAL